MNDSAMAVCHILRSGVVNRTHRHRVVGAMIAAACADALGAPYEFGPPGGYSAEFGEPVLGGIGEMIGGGGFGWAPGEFTDDTQMAVVLAHRIIADNGLDPTEVFADWQAWSTTAADVGITTRAALNGPDAATAAEDAHRTQLGGRSAGNGAVMRVLPLAIAMSGYRGDDATALTIELARRQSALTHYDPAAGWGAAVYTELVRRVLLGADPWVELPSVIDLIDDSDIAQFYRNLLDRQWTPAAANAPSNGTAWGCLAQAIWAVRTHDALDTAIIGAIDLGGDTDTVACVAGGLAGAMHGVQAVPSRWSTYVHGVITTRRGTERITNSGLQQLALELVGDAPAHPAVSEHRAGPTAVDDGLFVGSYPGVAAAVADGSFTGAVLSLCRVGEAFTDMPVRREVYLVDKEGSANPLLRTVVTDAVATITAWRDEGHVVVVHCHGGRSRTGLIVMAWAMQEYGWSAEQAREWLAGRWEHLSLWNSTFWEFLTTEWEPRCLRGDA